MEEEKMMDHVALAVAAVKPKKRVVIVGCGQIVTHHVEQMAGAGDESFQVMALCDPNPKRRQVILESCQQHGLPTFLSLTSSSSSTLPTIFEFDTLSEFLQYQQQCNTSTTAATTSAESDGVVNHTRDNHDEKLIFLIAVPHYLHESIALEALASGNHVVLEKPLAPTLQSCRILLDASSRYRKDLNNLLIVAEQSPFWEEIALAKTMIQNGDIGTIVSAASYFYESMRNNLTSGMDDGGLGWRCSLEKAGGGLVIDGGLHWIRPLREICGDVDRVVGVTRTHVAPELGMEGETLAHAIFQFKSPCTITTSDDEDNATSESNFLNQPPNSGPLFATFSCNMMLSAPMAHDSCPYFRFTGTHGELVVSGTGLNPNGGGGLRLYNEENLHGKDLFPADRQGGFYLGFRGLWREISRILDEDDWVAAEKTVENATKDVAVALAIYESARSGQWVTL